MTNNDVRNALKLIVAVAEVVREVGEAPEGVLYAGMMSAVSLEGFNSIIRQLKGAGLIEVKNHLVRWTGPALEAEPAAAARPAGPAAEGR